MELLWKTRDGQTLKVSEMEDTHLLNSIVMIRRKVTKLYVTDCKVYAGIGVKATDLLPRIYWAMIDELKNRKCQIPEIEGRILEL